MALFGVPTGWIVLIWNGPHQVQYTPAPHRRCFPRIPGTAAGTAGFPGGEIGLTDNNIREVEPSAVMTLSPNGKRFSLLRLSLGTAPKGLSAELWRAVASLRRYCQIVVVVLAVLSLGLIALLGIRPSFVLHAPLLAKLFVLGFGISLAALTSRIIRLWKKRIAEIVVDRGFRFCVGCGYELSGLASEGRCPECGAQYEVSDLRNKWASWM